MLGRCNGDQHRQKGERRPGNKAEHRVSAGIGESRRKSGGDDQAALHQAGGRQNVDKGRKNRRHGGDHPVEQALLNFGLLACVQVQQLGHLLIDILCVGADHDLVLPALFHYLDDTGHGRDLCGDFGRRGFLQDQPQAGGAVGRAGDVLLPDGILDVTGQLGIVTDFCHKMILLFHNRRYTLPHSPRRRAVFCGHCITGLWAAQEDADTPVARFKIFLQQKDLC